MSPIIIPTQKFTDDVNDKFDKTLLPLKWVLGNRTAERANVSHVQFRDGVISGVTCFHGSLQQDDDMYDVTIRIPNAY